MSISKEEKIILVLVKKIKEKNYQNFKALHGQASNNKIIKMIHPCDISATYPVDELSAEGSSSAFSIVAIQ